MDGGHSQLRTELNGRDYQFDISRIDAGGNALGTVLLAFDVTEQAAAEPDAGGNLPPMCPTN